MNAKKIMLIVSLPLCISLMGIGFWIMTEPQQDEGSSEAKQCREYLDQLEMLNRYKLFWTFIQRRLAYNDCLKRLSERHDQPAAIK
jgi:hypothetical protein